VNRCDCIHLAVLGIDQDRVVEAELRDASRDLRNLRVRVRAPLPGIPDQAVDRPEFNPLGSDMRSHRRLVSGNRQPLFGRDGSEIVQSFHAPGAMARKEPLSAHQTQYETIRPSLAVFAWT
jgi:hypothetical protein